jgi:hypothetical protein
VGSCNSDLNPTNDCLKLCKTCERSKLGAANKLPNNLTETEELSFEEKVEQMKKNILDGNFSSTIPKENIPIVTAHEFTKAIRKANAIDGWTFRKLSNVHRNSQFTWRLFIVDSH